MREIAELTILTAPKPFSNPHIALIQRNALRSWTALGQRVQVAVIGDEYGIAEETLKLGLIHIPHVARNEKGTPLISSMLEETRKATLSPFLAIVNTDILLFNDLLKSMDLLAARFQRFVMLGQRWDLKVDEALKFSEQIKNNLPEELILNASRHAPMGSDYFLFPRDCYQNYPDFAIGRAGWDNWMIYRGRLDSLAVVDCSEDVTIIHQSHDYSHLGGAKSHHALPETAENVRRGGGEQTIYLLSDANYKLKNGKVLRKPFHIRRLFREIEIAPVTLIHSERLGKAFFFLTHPIKLYHSIRTRK